MPPDFLIHWAPVLGPIATSLAVIVSLFVVGRDFRWRRAERRDAALGQARSIVINVKKNEANQPELNRIRNEGETAMFEVFGWSLAPDGSKQIFQITGSDQRFFQAIPAHSEKTYDAAQGQQSSNDPNVSSVQAVTWRDPSGQQWLKMGKFAPKRVRDRDAAESALRKVHAKVLKDARKQLQK